MEERLRIPIDGPNMIKLYDEEGNVIAFEYNRVVIGQRGAYIEFTRTEINWEMFHIPKEELKRVKDPHLYYYIEWRSKTESNLKLYEQTKEVNYADYVIGAFYLSPFGLYIIVDNHLEPVIIPLKSNKSEMKEKIKYETF